MKALSLFALLASGVAAVSLTRRGLIRGAAAGIAAPLVGRAAFAAPALTAAELLADVPVFAVTNAKGAPYLTERSAEGLRTGALYLSPADALSDLQNVRSFDPKASLSILPLGTIWGEIPKGTAEAKKFAAAAEPPLAGTSTDMRLFRIKTISDEEKAVLALFGSKQTPEGSVAVYWDPALLIQPKGAPEAQRPYFFRLTDLQQTIKEAGSGRKPEPRVSSLADVVDVAVRGGKAGEPPPLFYVASDAAAVVERAGSVSGDAEGGPAPASAAEAKMQRLVDICLKVPFKAA